MSVYWVILGSAMAWLMQSLQGGAGILSCTVWAGWRWGEHHPPFI